MTTNDNSQATASLPSLLRRANCASALTDVGYPISPKTLATMATRGGGPPYHKFGRAVLYRWSDALAWAERRLGQPRNSSSAVSGIDAGVQDDVQ